MSVSLSLCEISSMVWFKLKSNIVNCYRFRFNETLVVSTKSGPVKGYEMGSNFGYQYFNFFGIPYAKPPIGDLRFKDPQLFEPTDQIINEKFGQGGSASCQRDLIFKKAMGSEDCLHLSIYTREITPNTLKPVMVWIHGGAFITGSNGKDLYDPEYLLRYDVVVITINYRLGVFGLLSLNDPELNVPGNAGLKDQTMALKWIKENCVYFGGDPENIMLFGESAGGASISMHLISDLSKGLFHKAFVMSGTAYAPWVISPVNDWAQRMAKKLGWNGNGGEKACFNILKQASHKAIINAQGQLLTMEDKKHYILFPFSPVVEPYETEQCFLNKHPFELFRTAWSKDIPVIIGNCSSEGLLLYKFAKEEFQQPANIRLDDMLSYLNSDHNSEVCNTLIQDIAKQMKKFYFGYSEFSMDTILVYLKIVNDSLFAHPTHRMILSRVQNQSAPTYLLRFDFESERNMVKKLAADRNVPGVCHGDDFGYYFRAVLSGADPPKDSAEWKTIERMCDCLTSFAKYSNPNNNTIHPVQWHPITFDATDKPQYKCLNIADDVSFIDLPELDRMYFWDQIYKQLNKNII